MKWRDDPQFVRTYPRSSNYVLFPGVPYATACRSETPSATEVVPCVARGPSAHLDPTAPLLVVHVKEKT